MLVLVLQVQRTTNKRKTNNFINPHRTKCCYGLSMDLLDNIATELEFEFHLYIVLDELFGSKFRNLDDFLPPSSSNKQKSSIKSPTTEKNNNNKDDIKEQLEGEQTMEQGQRKYHTPEGRTRNRRKSSEFDLKE